VSHFLFYFLVLRFVTLLTVSDLLFLLLVPCVVTLLSVSDLLIDVQGQAAGSGAGRLGQHQQPADWHCHREAPPGPVPQQRPGSVVVCAKGVGLEAMLNKGSVFIWGALREKRVRASRDTSHVFYGLGRSVIMMSLRGSCEEHKVGRGDPAEFWAPSKGVRACPSSKSTGDVPLL
jgi:hypothetical protein